MSSTRRITAFDGAGYPAGTLMVECNESDVPPKIILDQHQGLWLYTPADRSGPEFYERPTMGRGTLGYQPLNAQGSTPKITHCQHCGETLKSLPGYEHATTFLNGVFRCYTREKIPPLNPRRPLDPDKPDGYMESDRDYLLNNIERALALLEREERR